MEASRNEAISGSGFLNLEECENIEIESDIGYGDPETKTITIDVPNLLIPGEFGVATKEEYIKDLKVTVFYVR